MFQKALTILIHFLKSSYLIISVVLSTAIWNYLRCFSRPRTNFLIILNQQKHPIFPGDDIQVYRVTEREILGRHV